MSLDFFRISRFFAILGIFLVRLEADFQRFASKSSSILSYFIKFTSKSKNLTIYSKIGSFSLIHTKSSFDLMRKLAEMLLVIIFLLVLVILALFLIFTANNIWSFVFFDWFY